MIGKAATSFLCPDPDPWTTSPQLPDSDLNIRQTDKDLGLAKVRKIDIKLKKIKYRMQCVGVKQIDRNNDSQLEIWLDQQISRHNYRQIGVQSNKRYIIP